MVKILVVEDDAIIRISLVDMLKMAKYDVIEAENGEVGLQQTREELPDLIISDIMMPKMDGYELFEAVKSDSLTAYIPFIFLTALAGYDDMRAGMNLGADDYLTKPFNFKQLAAAVNTRLNKHALEEKSRLRLFAQQLVNSQERERSQLAYELETNIQEPLNGLKIMLNLIKQTQDFSVLDTAYNVTEEVLNRSQTLSLHLMPRMIEHLNIISILIWLFEEYKKQQLFDVDFERAGHLPEFTTDEKIAIYRIFDEVLANVVTHAEASTVSVKVAVDGGRFFADIRDNGKGFDVQQAMNSNTIGLQSMFERAVLLNGELNIQSTIGTGTQVTLDVSVETDELDAISEIETPKVIQNKNRPTSISIVRILIADDYDIIRHGLQQIIDQDTHLTVVAHANNRQELLQQIQQNSVDIVILDLEIDDSNGFDTIKMVHQQQQDIRIIALSNHKQEVYAVEAIKSGADGYLLKEASADEVITAIHKVALGDQYLGEAIADKAFEWMLNSQSMTGKVKNIYDLLTDREREIMLLAITGLTSADIAEELTISPRTVEKHRSNFMSKLGLKTPAQLMRFASEQNLLG